MSIIQKQSIRSSIIITIGFAIGTINIILIQPKVITPGQYGLTKIITDAGLTLATICTLGSIPVSKTTVQSLTSSCQAKISAASSSRKKLLQFLFLLLVN